MRVHLIRPQYVDFMPRDIEDGVLYISKRFQTASHRCCCGCGIRIVTPLRKAEYSLIDQNGFVTIRPSIGNWDHPCQSHYLITENRVVWAAKMAPEQIVRGRVNDDAMRAAYFTKVKWPWWKRIAHWTKRRVRSLFE